jgi:hypothetical protein
VVLDRLKRCKMVRGVLDVIIARNVEVLASEAPVDLPSDPDDETALLEAAGGDLLLLFQLNWLWKNTGLDYRDSDDWRA